MAQSLSQRVDLNFAPDGRFLAREVKGELNAEATPR